MPELSYEVSKAVMYLVLLLAGPTGRRLAIKKPKKFIWLGWCYEELIGGIDSRTIEELIRGN